VKTKRVFLDWKSRLSGGETVLPPMDSDGKECDGADSKQIRFYREKRDGTQGASQDLADFSVQYVQHTV
jgi:hypothetical protein